MVWFKFWPVLKITGNFVTVGDVHHELNSIKGIRERPNERERDKATERHTHATFGVYYIFLLLVGLNYFLYW